MPLIVALLARSERTTMFGRILGRSWRPESPVLRGLLVACSRWVIGRCCCLVGSR